ncbi:hypothetical protein DFW101_1021 [Solidesulfovibrio carbinoliphilus subsp. oakridgensis]|uniref:Uncharacterized protein n=1 Tax=Solidesulfovibrio carbinoliphilus subsp. oakridgensis TaxID=694327 RepID=G7Q619_9BACT|nr:hypothetical protein [Solidesulfovibrio carbinoliphilus]EHJ47035.1 hypothetical protein DFW101_1021 [Solidesulfovibrio carbinoliphilus subsp. oakridgensis]
MKRYLYMMGAVIVGTGLYAAHASEFSAQQVAPSRGVEVAVAPMEPQTVVARLAEASLAMRRVDGNPVVVASPEPLPEKLFAKK